ncbi:sensor histidine kinase [Paenibacillus sp. HWE-109]|uniref:sensor histidine kinase n=1 Tax=Paenibacillus sp. HWE-109 TaxID=1306526 RepID=UPI001EE13830|nr:sensor histidine kinase [Paenibacillus sp. HWE-109]UKS28166.1 sensor histidine kinase [Paenibacillus sp. HWE-109]
MKIGNIINVKKSIQSKIFVAFILALVVPAIIISMSSYYISVQILKNKVSSSYLETAMYIGNSIEKDLLQLEQMSDYIFTSSKNYDYLTGNYNSISESYSDFKKMNQSIENYFTYVKLSPYVSYIAILGNNGYLYLNGNDSMGFKAESMKKSSWYNQTLQLNGQINWIGAEELTTTAGSKRSVISFSRAIKDSDFKNTIGVAYIAVTNDVFSNSLKKVSTHSNNQIFLLDNNGNIVVHPDSEQINKHFDEVSKWGGTTNGSYLSSEKGQQYLVAYQFINQYGWWVVEKIPFSELIKDNRQIIDATLLVCFISFIIFGSILYFVSSAIVKPIKGLTKIMKNVKNGNIGSRASYTGEDEIGILSHNFNYMLDRINFLFNSNMEEQNMKRDAEYQALQAQINPHFLYNTLNTIRWMAIIKKEDGIKAVVESLGRLLKNTTSKMDPYILVKDELSNLKDYVFIQKLRYKDKFDIIYDIKEECLACKCIKFILQPIVENAIFHGIEPKEGRGTIWLHAEIHENLLIFLIKDDGVGIPTQKISHLLSGKAEDRKKFNGIGVKNINDRIKMEYGEHYGIQIESKENEYTSYKVILPSITASDEATKS